MPNQVIISTGSNIGNRLAHLSMAADYARNLCGEIKKISSVYESKSWGFKGNDFYNQVFLMETDLEEIQVFLALKKIESDLGKKAKIKEGYEDRIIDVDLIFFNDQIIDEDHLQVPHPRMHLRKFVLVPLADICPNWIHPSFNTSVAELLEKCEDTNDISKVYV